MSKVVVLVSGGMDSLVTAAVAKKENDELYFLHANYGQITEKKELESFNNIIEYYNPVESLVVDISYLKEIGGSSLTDTKIKIKDFSGSKEIPNTYVPFRNAHLVSIATSWAEVINAKKIYIGAVEEDSSGYPDCRELFFKSMALTINLGTKDNTKIEIVTPIIHKSKAEIIKIGKILNTPFEYSWSCYRNNKIACGTCDSCVLRIKAFKEAGEIDPIPYKININW